MDGRLFSAHRHNLAVGALIVLGVLTRFIPHLPNFTAVGAVGLAGAALWTSRKWAVWAPLLILLLSDWLFGVLTPWKGWYAGQAFVYAGFLAYPLVGMWMLRGRRWSWMRMGMAAVVASFAFFVVSNFGVWLTGTMYPHTPAGLLAAYAAGLPFWGYQLMGDLFYSTLIVTAWHALHRWKPAWVRRFADIQ